MNLIKKHKTLLQSLISNFVYDDIIKIKSISYSFLSNSLTERELETNSFIFDLKNGKILVDKLDEIIQDITKKIDLSEIDYITYTPDSGNYGVLHTEIVTKGFSSIVLYLANKLNIPVILPTITREMGKQKDQKSLSDRLKNRLGAYSFNESLIKGKTILFIDDVLTTGATMLAIADDIYKKGGDLELYFLAHAERDEDNTNN